MVLLLALSNVLSRAGERVALIGDPEPPISGRAVAERLADRLQHRTQVVQANAENERSLPPPALLPAHAHAVMISDFLSPIDEFHALLERFAARDVRGHLLQVLDPAEVAMPFLGRVRFRGMEREGELLMSRVESIPAEQVRIGMRVKVRVHAPAEGEEGPYPVFDPVENA